MPWLLTRGERRRRNWLQGGRLHLGTVAGIKSEWWPTSFRNRWPACVGIRTLTARSARCCAKLPGRPQPPECALGRLLPRPAKLSGQKREEKVNGEAQP